MTKQIHERRILTVDGVSKELGEWAFEKGLTADTLLKRLNRGWDVRKAVNTPAHTRRNNRQWRRYKLDGESLALGEWAKRAGLRRETLRYRVEHGWDMRRAVTESARRDA